MFGAPSVPLQPRIWGGGLSDSVAPFRDSGLVARSVGCPRAAGPIISPGPGPPLARERSPEHSRRERAPGLLRGPSHTRVAARAQRPGRPGPRTAGAPTHSPGARVARRSSPGSAPGMLASLEGRRPRYLGDARRCRCRAPWRPWTPTRRRCALRCEPARPRLPLPPFPRARAHARHQGGPRASSREEAGFSTGPRRSAPIGRREPMNSSDVRPSQ